MLRALDKATEKWQFNFGKGTNAIFYLKILTFPNNSTV